MGRAATGFSIFANAARHARIALPAAVFTQVCEATVYTTTFAGGIVRETVATGTSGGLMVRVLLVRVLGESKGRL